MTAYSPSVEITKDDDRPWIEKWIVVEHHITVLREIYSGAVRMGNVEAESRANIIFIECDHLRDWLRRDKSLHLTLNAINKEVWPSETSPLALANAICNSHKHHTRTGDPPPMTARVWRTKTDGSTGGTQVIIKLNWGANRPRYRDGLQLADQCVAAWRKFFKAHNIEVPS